MSVTFKNIVIRGNAADEKGGTFILESSGDVKITADPDTIGAVAKYLEEVSRNAA